MICSGLYLFLAIRPPFGNKLKNTNLTYGPIFMWADQIQSYQRLLDLKSWFRDFLKSEGAY